MPDLTTPPPDPPSKKHNEVAIELVSGSVGGALQVLVGQPLDTLKTRAQTAPKGKYKNTLDILTKTVKSEGPLALYKGMLSPLIGIAAVNSLLFTAYGASRRLVSPYPDLSIKQVAVAGGMAGAANAILASPVEMFKIRMQGQYGGAGDKKLGAVISSMWREWGLRDGILRGYWVTVVREIPAYMGFYAGYETTKRAFAGRYGSEPLPIWTLLTSGATGGVCYWLACYPLDVVKSRVQLASHPPSRGGWFEGGYIGRELRAIIREGGVRSLFRGLSPSLLRAAPAAAATFVGFELTRDFITKRNIL
ncbi:mitochondrial carrier domain-containing protein [Kockovaella imperatae]|uniref:Mitochondrial carrier domain-containing protein n=1 Tax=Kockovaella imperatae TaxID=4999 RepID=A0A1Y1ULR6_9TREE|nr:mitochondrial carrier domain-containing protein [Kockovaella imperatae]ORX38983.1 mitochondrial carrier domain-containing protein [Kockovaella imperatae]